MTLKTQCTLCSHTNAAGWPSDARCPGCGRHDEPQGDDMPDEPQAYTEVERLEREVEGPAKHRDHDTRGCGKWCADA